MTGTLPGLTLRLGATLRLCAAGGAAQVLEGTGALLAARLALAGPQPRGAIAPLLWPDVGEARARANLRQRLLRLKALAGREWIVGEAELRLAADVHIDDSGAGELLAGIDATLPSDELRAWLDAARRQHLQRRSRTLVAEAEAAEAAQDWPAALAAAEGLLALEPHSEEAHRRRIRLHYLQGDSGRAAEAVAECQRMLRREFGAAPSAATLELVGLLARGAAGRRAEPPPGPAAQHTGLATALLRPPRMVGRHAEHAALHAAARAGHPALVVAEAGMGKSRLLAELAAAWPREQVAAVKAQVGDAGVPYATLARLLHGACHPRGVPVPPLAPAAGTVEAAAWRLQLQQAVAATLATLGVALVLVDDLHAADPASLEAVQALATQPEAGPAILPGADGNAPCGAPAWVMAMRPAEAGHAARTLADALADARAERPQALHLALAPLGEAQVAELLVEVGLAHDQAAALAPALARHTGGNPLFVLETLRGMPLDRLATGEGTPRLPQPASVGALIERRLRQLSPGALALARAAAIVGPDFSPALAEAVLQRPAIDLADAWAELESAQVLREMAFAHDLVFETTLAGIPRPIARHLHGAVARWLEAQGGEPARVAAHWLEAGATERALPWLRQAAVAAAEALRVREALDFIEQAIDIGATLPGTPAGVSLFEMQFCAADWHLTAGTTARAQAAFERALAWAGSAQQRVLTLDRLMEVAQKAGDFDAARRLGGQALAEAQLAGDESLVCDALLDLLTTLTMVGEFESAAQLLDRHWALCERTIPRHWKPVAVRAMVLDNLGRISEAHPFHEMTLQRIRDEPPTEHLVHLGNAAINRIDAGDLGRAAELLAQAARIESAHDAAPSDGQARLRALVARDSGRFGAALAEFERALELDSLGAEPFRKLSHVNRAWLWRDVGQWTRALRDIEAAGDLSTMPAWVAVRVRLLQAAIASNLGQGDVDLDVPVDTPLTANVRYALAFAQLAQQVADRSAAVRALMRCREIEGECVANGMLGAAAAARLHGARFAVAAGEPEQARQLAASCMRLEPGITPAEFQQGAWWHALWRLWLALGDPERAAATRAEGLAWLHHTMRHHLPAEFHAGFREVPEHAALLRG